MKIFQVLDIYIMILLKCIIIVYYKYSVKINSVEKFLDFASKIKNLRLFIALEN